MMKMRMVATAVVAALSLTVSPRVAAAQGALPSVGEVTVALSSPDADARARATGLAQQAVHSQDANTFVRNSDFQSAVLRALRAINEELTKLAKPDPNAATDEDKGEGLVTNASYLLDVAMRIVPALPDDSKRMWMRDLVASPYNDDSPYAAWLANYGDVAVDALIARASSNNLDGIQRGNAYSVLAQMVAITAFRPGVNIPFVSLSYANRQRAIAKVNEGLDRKDIEARMIVPVLKKYPSADGLSILQAYRERARGVPDFTRAGSGRVPSLQHDVEDAISSIQAASRR
jgi:hypothetical protein